jgi:TrmH family RNA methyltransferase
MAAAARRDPGMAVLEGFHAVKHAIRFGAEILGLTTPDRPALMGLAADLAPDVAEALGAAVEIPAGQFAALSPHPVPTPVLAIARRPEADLGEVMSRNRPIVLLDRPMHLGNIGAVVRVAAAADAAAVLTTGDRDPWDPAALRGSAGLHFALPVIRVDRLPDSQRPLVAIHPDGERLTPGIVPDRAVLAFGSERSGLSPELIAAADRRLAIPMREGVSSLNLATAVAVVLYS